MSPSARRVFSLEEAQRLLPEVRRITAEAVEASSRVADELEDLPETDPRRADLLDQLNELVQRWAETLRGMHLEAKGLWLVDFDNGEGYYCWAYPEESVGHYHGYAEGFAGRMKIL